MNYLDIEQSFFEDEDGNEIYKKYTVLSPAEFYECTEEFIDDEYGTIICYNPKNKEIFKLLNKRDINGNGDFPSNIGGRIYGDQISIYGEPISLSQEGNCLVAQSCYLRGDITIEDNAQLLAVTRIEFTNLGMPSVLIADNAKLVNSKIHDTCLTDPDLDTFNSTILILDNTVLINSYCLLYKSSNLLLVYSGTTTIDNIEIDVRGHSGSPKKKIVFYNTYIQNKSDERYKIRITFVDSCQCIGKYLVFTNRSIKKYIDNFQSLTSYEKVYTDIRAVPSLNIISIVDVQQNKFYVYDLTEFIKTYTQI